MKKVFIVFLVAILLLVFVGCTEKSSPTPKPAVDPFYTEGFTKGEASTQNMVDELVNILLSSFKPLTVADKQKTDASVEAKIDLDVNGLKFEVVLKVNYSPSNKDNNAFSFEIVDKSTNKPTIGAYLLANEDKHDLYLLLNNNKIYIGLQSQEFIFPIDLSSLDDISRSLSKILITVGDIKYEYRNSSEGTSRHFYAKINLEESLKTLYSLSKMFGYDTESFDFIFQNLLGVTLDGINNGHMPKSIIELEFYTERGSADSFGKGSISKIDLKLNVERSANLNTIFLGKAYYSNISVNYFKVNRSLINNIVKKEDLKDYVKYNTTAFSFKFDLNYAFKKTDYLLNLDFFYDEMSIENTQIALVFKEKNADLNTATLYLRDSRLYFNIMDGDVEKNFEADFDFSKMIEEFEVFFSQRESTDFLKILVYLLGAIRIEDVDKISYQFVFNNFSDISGLNIDTLITLIDNASDDDVKMLLEESEINLKTLLSQTFTINLKLDENFVSTTNVFDFPDDLSKLN